MLEFKQTIEEKAYNDMRELVGWRRLDPQQAQTGLDNSIFTTVAYDANEPVGMARIVGDGGYMYLIVDVMDSSGTIRNRALDVCCWNGSMVSWAISPLTTVF